MSIEKLVEKKVLFVTGKGGVGKSTNSAALSYGLAKQGYKVLAIDADPAHSLPDVFGISKKVYSDTKNFPTNGKLTSVYDGLPLDLLVLNPVINRDNYKGGHRVMWLVELGKELGFYSNLSRMSEFFTLSDTLYKCFNKYDKFVIDNEPSAGTLDMVECIDGWIKGLKNVKKYSSVFKIIFHTNLIDKRIAKEVNSLVFGQNGALTKEYQTQLNAVKKLFRDKKNFEPIIVASSEDAVLRETTRLRKELAESLDLQNQHVIFNKVMVGSDSEDFQKQKISQFIKFSKLNGYIVPYLDSEKINLENEINAKTYLNEIIDSFSSF